MAGTKKVKSGTITPLHVVILWRDGCPPKYWKHFCDALHKPKLFSAKDSPMGFVTSSIFLDTDDVWNDVEAGQDQCYKSSTKHPLYLLRFKGFESGDWLVFTDIAWSLKVHSLDTHDGKTKGTFRISPFDDKCGTSAYSNDDCPTNTATIRTVRPAVFKPSSSPSSKKGEDRKKSRDRREFLHQDDPTNCHKAKLRKVVLRVGTEFKKTFRCPENPTDCVVTLGFPPNGKS